MNEKAYQELWAKQRKKTRLQRWFCFFAVASIFFAWFASPYIGAYFIVDAALPIVKESFKDRAAGSDQTRRFIFTDPSSVKEFKAALSLENIPFEVRHSAAEPYVIKISEKHMLAATNILRSRAIQPDFTDVALEVGERKLKVEATTKIYR